MKKPLRILVLCLLAFALAFTVIGCNNNANDGDADKGLVFKKARNETNYTVTKFVDDGVTVGADGVLDIGVVAQAKGITAVKIKANAFKGNDTIKKLIVPSTVEEIEQGAFAGMKALEEIVLPFIGASKTGDAFMNQTLPAENKAVNEKRSFGYLFGTTEYEEGKSETFKFGAGDADKITCFIPYALEKITVNPSGQQVLPMYAFAGLTGVKEIELGSQVSYVGDYAFAGSDVKVVKLSNTVSEIGEGSFSGCNGIKEIDFSGCPLLTKIGVKAFLNCSNLETVKLNANTLKLGNEAFAYCAKLDTAELETNCEYNSLGRVFVK